MTVKIEIDCDNSAFSPDPNQEIARILRKLADDLEAWNKSTRIIIHDLNGNSIGYCIIREE